MALRSWLRNLFAPRTRPIVRKAPARCRPSLETLEGREVPAAILGFHSTHTTEGGCAVAVGDFNGDGRPDFATPDPWSGYIRVFEGNGDGTFRSVGQFASGTSAYSVAVGDFNGDGRPDLAAAGISLSNDIGVLLGNGDGTFGPAATYTVGGCPRSVAVADFN